MEKLDEVTQEMWLQCNEKNRKLVEEYLRESTQLSDQTLSQYTSALKIYFNWIRENCDNKGFWEITSKNYLFYQNFLTRRGLSSSAIKFKRSAVSSLNNYILLFYLDQYPNFRQYVNKGISNPPKNIVHEKEPLTLLDFDNLCNKLEEMECWQELAWLKVTFSTGCRKAESRQLLKEIVNYEPKISKVVVKNEDGKDEIKESRSYISHKLRCKGRGRIGSVRSLQFGEDAMIAIKKWLEVRGNDDNPYVFVSKQNDKVKQISLSGISAWNSVLFTKLIGRRMNAHNLRVSRASSLVMEQHRDIKVAQKLLGHKDILTTEGYVVRKGTEDSDESFLD